MQQPTFDQQQLHGGDDDDTCITNKVRRIQTGFFVCCALYPLRDKRHTIRMRYAFPRINFIDESKAVVCIRR